MANSGSGGMFQCFGPLDRQTSLALITFYGGTSSHWCTKLPLTVLRTLLLASLQLLGKSGTRPVFSLTFDLQCAGDVRPASRPGDVILNTYFDDDRCLFNALFS
ncbi:hypothetical protein AVEN_160252-1 [Araneus ventricosus]|uniref:Uncharacterized protein n=1 Tax=Araneus ventricosus TaxID=182803 RepID=A0A4Y2KX39_ARAVE|nr:hypothetical protein AVEN_125804-1 [Araneus ventricosus]GBN42768.1 hypothetical protein AVEN_160252-1 [Araneus ventricosus]